MRMEESYTDFLVHWGDVSTVCLLCSWGHKTGSLPLLYTIPDIEKGLQRSSAIRVLDRLCAVQEFTIARNIYLVAGHRKVRFTYNEFVWYRSARHDIRRVSDWAGKTAQSLGPTRSLMMPMIHYQGRSSISGFTNTFEQLFEVFGEMQCSTPQDRVLTLLGLLERDPHRRQRPGSVVSLIDYSLSVWVLLSRILQAPYLSEPVRFAGLYNKNILADSKAADLMDYTQQSSNVLAQFLSINTPYMCLHKSSFGCFPIGAACYSQRDALEKAACYSFCQYR